MRKETITLAVLVSVLLLVNSMFLVIIQSGSYSGDIGIEGRVIQALSTKNDPVKLFTPEIFTTYSPDEEKTTNTLIKSPTVTTTSSTQSPSSRTGINRIIPFIEDREKEEIPSKPNTREFVTPEGKEIVIDYDRKVFTYDGEEIPMIVDPIVGKMGEIVKFPSAKSAMAGTTSLSFNRFDIDIDSDYYAANQANLDDFFSKFEDRFDDLELTTGWSAEEYYGQKLLITINPTVSGCWGAQAISPATVDMYLSDPLYKPSCERDYYSVFGGTPQSGNAGELGDNWFLMAGMIHESLHGISPLPYFTRPWLAEGFSQYNQYNILAEYGDITQETADTYIYSISESGYNWDSYVLNDYKDPLNNALQDSDSYDITAWMLTMSRDPAHSPTFNNYLSPLVWSSFYEIMGNNQETLYSTMGATNKLKKDAHIIDLISRASSQSLDKTKNAWKYYGPSGPGWGVREWVDVDWYADLVPEITLINPTDNFPSPGDMVSVNAKIVNNGDVTLEDVEYQVIYDNGTSQSTKTTHSVSSIPAQGEATITIPSYQVQEDAPVKIKIIVDSSEIKLETDKTNNQVTEWIGFEPIADIDVKERSTVSIYPRVEDYEGNGINYEISGDGGIFEWNETLKRFSWQTTETSSTNFDVTIRATDTVTLEYQEQVVNINVQNTCIFDKDKWEWTCNIGYVDSSTLTNKAK